MNKKAIILCVIFSIIFLVLGVFIGILFQKNKSIETSYSKEEAEKILREYKKKEKDYEEIVEKPIENDDKWSYKEPPKSSEDDVLKQAELIALRTFNSNFTPYFGDSNSASQVRALVSSVKSSNALNKEHQIILEPSDIDKKVNSAKKYNIDAEFDDAGYINKIIIEEM